MSKIWVKENRNSFTPLHEFGLHGINLTPGAVIQMIMTPALQKAIDADYVIEVIPIWDKQRDTITGFQEVIIVDEVEEVQDSEEGEE